MTDPGTTRTRRGAHRARREILRILVVPLLALAVVGAMIAGFVVWLGDSAMDQQDLAVAPRPAASSPQPSPEQQRAGAAGNGLAGSASVPMSVPVSTPVPSAVRPATAAEPTSGETASTAPATTRPSATAEPARDPVQSAKSLPIVVLNQTPRTGLAAAVAGRLRAGGWRVRGVGNFRGSVAGTTVYYPPGERAEAVTLAAILRGPDRVRPRFGNLSTRTLTVVLASDYPG
jgi:hypothetical protein